MKEGDRRLEHVGPAPTQGERAVDHRLPSLYLLHVPERAVLVAEQHQLPAGEARLSPAGVGQHQCEQTVDLGLIGHQLRESAAEADRLGRELTATAVALLEDRTSARSGMPSTIWAPSARGCASRPSSPEN